PPPEVQPQPSRDFEPPLENAHTRVRARSIRTGGVRLLAAAAPAYETQYVLGSLRIEHSVAMAAQVRQPRLLGLQRQHPVPARLHYELPSARKELGQAPLAALAHDGLALLRRNWLREEFRPFA